MKNEEFAGESKPIDPPWATLVREEVSGGLVHRSYRLSDEYAERMQDALNYGAEARAKMDAERRREDKQFIAWVAVVIASFAAGVLFGASNF